jgi:hypothetical protein
MVLVAHIVQSILLSAHYQKKLGLAATIPFSGTLTHHMATVLGSGMEAVLAMITALIQEKHAGIGVSVLWD